MKRQEIIRKRSLFWKVKWDLCCSFFILFILCQQTALYFNAFGCITQNVPHIQLFFLVGFDVIKHQTISCLKPHNLWLDGSPWSPFYVALCVATDGAGIWTWTVVSLRPFWGNSGQTCWAAVQKILAWDLSFFLNFSLILGYISYTEWKPRFTPKN